MLIRFRVKNFLSFKNEVVFSLQASSISERLEENTFVSTVNEIRILKGGAFYGANASGKSNLFRALKFFVGFSKDSAKEHQAKEPISVTPFKLATATINEPSFFEIEFIHNDKKYRYSFTTDKNSVHQESLFIQTKIKEHMIFDRKGKDISIESKYSVSDDVITLTRSNALFLSTAAMLNVSWASETLEGLDKFRFVGDEFPSTLEAIADTTGTMLEDPKYRTQLLKLFRAGDLGFEEIVSEVIPFKLDQSYFKHFPESSRKFFFDNKVRIVSTIHNLLDEEGNPQNEVMFNMNEESEGTRRYYFLAGFIIEALYQGRILIIDEFTSRLHPLLGENIIRLFHSKKINHLNAQLIIATHNTYLLNEEIYRRDQIFITNKNKFYSTEISNLFEKNVRKDATFEKRYIQDKQLQGIPNWKLSEDDFWGS